MMKIARQTLIVILLMLSVDIRAHHMVVYVYDEATRFTTRVEVIEFQFINPHPFLIVKSDRKNEAIWRLEMDNRWELVDLGFDRQTFQPGDHLEVTLDRSRHSETTLYLRGVIHRAKDFKYIHNHRRLYPVQ